MAEANATQQVEGMLGALERQGTTILRMADWVQRKATPLSYEPFRQFIDQVRSYQTLSALVDTRLGNVKSGTKHQRLRQKFNELNRLVYRTSLLTLANFFMLFTENEQFPIGVREVFERALRLVQTIRDTLSENMADRILDAEFPVTLDELEALIDEVVHRSPDLQDFDAPAEPAPPAVENG